VKVLPGGFAWASSKGRCTAKDVLDIAAGNAALKSLFSREQRAFYADGR
jgi:hypothetical protein